MPRRRQNNPPRVMTAKYAGQCARKPARSFKPGDTILYADGKAYCTASKAYRDWMDAEFDRTVLGQEY